MFSFIARRVAVGSVVLLGATFIVFMMVAWAVDPLADLRTSNVPNKQFLIEQRTEALDLDMAPVLRYFKWLGNVVAYLWGQGTFGVAVTNGQPVADQLAVAVPTTLKLVSASVVLAILLGVTVGIVTALRQYSSFDYLTTFFTFLFYSLPAFWVAVLLKQFGAIRFNDFLADPRVPIWAVALVALAVGGLAAMVAAGRPRGRLIIGLVAFAGAAAVMGYISASNFLLEPGLGIVGVTLTGAGAAVALAALTAGLSNRRALWASLSTVAVGAALYFPLQYAFVHASWPVLLGLWATSAVVGVAAGLAWGGDDRFVSARTAALTGLVMSVFVFADRLMKAWPSYVGHPRVNGRPIGTLGAVTPELGGTFWLSATDVLTHLVLPTTALVLISFASYTRYTRASMLEVMNADYIRTARAKGLGERTVVVRHAFRNALIPLATVIPIDIALIFGGAIITERIFSWRGMGTMFIEALRQGEIYSVMGYFLVTAALAISANIVADLIYAGLDPRIRVNA
ncbi:MAG: ABC transporter permease [Bifidobacteriaceae bacterium]|nr:ABC transporter permease [Bifidobacteriaceae bacterium]